ncbi:hypothetical protein DL240_14435 [Lujinxingia litoralis]|uniref:YprB ribonuclease H-like domain-containing protein n=1 Tax=Lujinxingia litoralis TaxID=2211119 RepID=A0A328C3K4_9DELT|nr:ribonuclease H-like domain-containing protein [Lujinxingia litoralis]RAL20878.1 hypothetical protein DL240_14435 [Lujinxingia litoralis]
MSKFGKRLERLHQAHQRGRESQSGPSGVFEAGAPGEGEVRQVKGGSSPDGGGFDDSGERAEGSSGSIVRKASPRGASRGGARTRHRSSGGARRSSSSSKITEKNWGQWGAENQGEFWLLREEVPPGEVHGRFEVGACREIDHRLISKVDPGCPGVRPEGLLYMDTETSGLGQGALAFCVGIGFWAGERFVVEQLLLDGSDAAGERAMLAYFANMLRERHLLVTFNGRRFDVPLLARRYARHQMSDPFGGRQHLDLLPTARRHFVGRKRYKLSSLEEDILDFHRVDDVPGREIPALWERFVAGEAVPKMGGMLEHNRHDIVSMAALLAAQIEAVGGGARPGSAGAPGGSVGAPGALGARGSGGSSAYESAPGGARERGGRIGEVAARLERSYRLRSSFSAPSDPPGSARPPASRERAGERARAERGVDRPRADERSEEAAPAAPAALRERVRALRAAARAMIDAGLFEQAAPALFELVALAPDDRFGLQTLARYYRQAGQDALAREIEARFRGGGGGGGQS